MRLTKGHLQLAILAVLGGFGSWVIANYETLLPYRWETFRAANGEFSLKFPGRAVVEDRREITDNQVIFPKIDTA